MSTCPECNSTNLEQQDDVLLCMSCGFQVEEKYTVDDAEVNRDGRCRFDHGHAIVTQESGVEIASSVLYFATEKIVKKLVDPLAICHSQDTILSVRHVSSQMIQHIMSSEEGIKNRALRKKGILAHLVTRVLMHVVPEYNDKEYLERVLVPYFFERSEQPPDAAHVVHKYMRDYGVDVFRMHFPAYDAMFENDYENFLQCKLRRIFKFLVQHGQFGALLLTKTYEPMFDFTGFLIMHDAVHDMFQTWSFATRAAVFICAMGLSNPDEIVRIIHNVDTECVQSATIHQKLRQKDVQDVVSNYMTHNPKVRDLHTRLLRDRMF